MPWLVTLGFVAVTLLATRSGHRGLEGMAKALASSGFVWAAIDAGAMDSGHGRAVVVGLGLSWLGDVLLVAKARRWFLVGLGAFQLAHVAYAVAFVLRGIEPMALGGALAVLLLPGWLVWRWLQSRVGRMGAPVLAYILIISTMLALAVATVIGQGGPWVFVGAALFYVSDLFVARERFVHPSFLNRLVGLPIYYGAQLLLATFAGA